jgi:hypothetical protein
MEACAGKTGLCVLDEWLNCTAPAGDAGEEAVLAAIERVAKTTTTATTSSEFFMGNSPWGSPKARIGGY